MREKIKKCFSHEYFDVWIFVLAMALVGFSRGTLDSTFNNFLDSTFSIGGIKRSILELPREFPGFAVIFVSAIFFFLSSRRMAAIAMYLYGIGMLLIGFFSSSFNVMLVWLFIMSLGQHIFIPLQSSIGMDLAKSGKEGRRLGQLLSIRSLSIIVGSAAVFVGFKFFNFNFKSSFLMGAIALFVGATAILFMKPVPATPAKTHLRLHKEYRLFYWLNILFGTRKQLFLTFGPWVLVTVYNQPTEIIASVLTAGGISGVLFQPLLGMAIDRFGERFILSAEALVLIVVCIGYGFAKFIFPENIAFIIAASCFVADMMLMSVTMARATYLKKIAKSPSHVAPTLAMGVSIDHIFSIALALVSGVVWANFGYQYVFLIGALVAIINFFSATMIRIPKESSV